jgi:hypothetical protein
MGASARYDGTFEQQITQFLIFKQQTTKEPAIAVEGPSKLLTLKRKVGYNEVNDEAEKRSAGNRSIRAMEVATEEELAGNLKHCISTMEVDNPC